MTDAELMDQLRVVPDADIPLDVLAQIQSSARHTRSRFTVLEIKATRTILILIHKAERASMTAIREAYIEEVEGLPTTGAMQ